MTIWEGEIPRSDASGNAITLLPGQTLFKVLMPEEGLNADWNFEDSFTDEGSITIYVWNTKRAGVETALTNIEAILSSIPNWSQIPLPGGQSQDPWLVMKMVRTRWTCIHLEGLRTRENELIYEGRISFDVGIHTSVPCH